jgi:hypothetical protein
MQIEIHKRLNQDAQDDVEACGVAVRILYCECYHIAGAERISRSLSALGTETLESL